MVKSVSHDARFRVLRVLQDEPIDEVEKSLTILNISGTGLRRRLAEGLEIPDWFSFPNVVTELRRTRPAKFKQGFTVFFTGLSGSGKSTIANAVMVKIMEMGGRPVTLLDGYLVRKNISSELGFSKRAPLFEYPPYRLSCFRNHQERRDRHLRANRALHRHPTFSARGNREFRHLRRGLRLHQP